MENTEVIKTKDSKNNLIKKRKIQLNNQDIYIFWIECPELSLNEKYKEQHRLGRLLLSEALKTIYNINFNEWELRYNKHSKPYLKNFKDIHFNISHSSKIVILAISNNEVGIDIEETTSFNSHMIERIFSSNEINSAKKFINKNEYFTRLWTLKECYFKRIGTGLEFPLTSTSFVLNTSIFPLEFYYKNNYFYQNIIGKDSIFSICLKPTNR